MKEYLAEAEYQEFRDGYHECVRMLNGLEKALARKLPAHERRYDNATSDPSSLPSNL